MSKVILYIVHHNAMYPRNEIEYRIDDTTNGLMHRTYDLNKFFEFHDVQEDERQIRTSDNRPYIYNSFDKNGIYIEEFFTKPLVLLGTVNPHIYEPILEENSFDNLLIKIKNEMPEYLI